MDRFPLMPHFTRERYARFLVTNPLWIIIVILILTLVSVVVAFGSLKMERSSIALFSPDSPDIQEYRRYTAEFGEPDDLIVVVEGETPTRRRAFVELLAQQLEHEPVERIQNVLYHVPITTMATFMMASDEELDELVKILTDPKEPFHRLLAAPNFEGLLIRMADLMHTGMEEETAAEDPQAFFEASQQFFHAFREELMRGQADGAALLLNWGGRVFDRISQADDQGFLVADGGQVHFLFVKPGDASADTDKAIELVQSVRAQIGDLLLEFPGLTVGLTGDPALTHDEFAISERDMTLATIFALVMTLLIFFWSFRSIVHPLLGFACLVMAVSMTFGLTTVTIGHLNLVSLTFAVILIGLGVQYGIHIIARYEEERAQQRGLEDTILLLMKNTVPSLFVGALTTSAAFFATAFIDFRGFQELAFIAGSGVLLCFLMMSFGLPAFLVWNDRRRPDHPSDKRPMAPRAQTRFSRGYTAMIARFPKSILVFGGLLSLFSVLAYMQWGPRPYFDYNLLNLQAKDAEAVEYMKQLMETDFSPRFAILRAENEAEAQELARELEAQPSVARVEALFNILPSASEEKVQKVRRLGRYLKENFAFGNRPSNPKALIEAIGSLEKVFEEVQEKLFAGGYTEALIFAESSVDEMRKTQAALQKLPEATAVQRLNRMQEDIQALLSEFFSNEAKRDPVAMEEIPDAIRSRFISEAGTYALYIYPAISVWNKEGLQTFVTELRAVSDRVTGPVLQMFAALSAMDTGWILAALYAALAIFVIFFLDFRSLSWALIACAPLVCGVTWIYGGMAIVGLRWNIVNLIALPLVLGIGADCGVHLIHRYREEKKADVSFVLTSTGKAVTVAYSETLVSFLGLAVAHHQGLASLGQVIIWGVFCCYVAGMILLPSLLQLRHSK